MKLIIIRHGETDYNVKGLIQGQKDCHLTSNGEKQSDVLSERLKDEQIDVFYSSPLKRSLDTANTINKFHNMKIETPDLLKERSFGIFEGKLGRNLDNENPGCLKDPFFKPKNGEDMNDVFSRAKQFIEIISQYEHSNKTVLIVAHKIINLAIIGILMDKSIEETYQQKLDSTSICEIQINHEENILVNFNDTKHLDKAKLKKVKEIKGIC